MSENIPANSLFLVKQQRIKTTVKNSYKTGCPTRHVKDSDQTEHENQQDASFTLGGCKRNGLTQ